MYSYRVAPVPNRNRDDAIYYSLSHERQQNGLYIENKRYAFEISTGDIATCNSRLLQVCKELARQVDSEGITLSQVTCAEYLAELRRFGSLAYKTYFSNEARKRLTSKEEATFSSAQPKVHMNIRFPQEQSLIWELMYDGADDSVDPEHFWGFRMPLGRTYWEIDPTYFCAMRSGMITIAHDQLKSTEKELQQIKLLMLDIATTLGLEFTASSLDDYLLGTSPAGTDLLRLLAEEGVQHGIVHFACHGRNPTESAATEARLTFTWRQHNLQLTLEDLYVTEIKLPSKPIVFLNACDTDTLEHFLEMLTFPHGWLNLDAASVIATACSVPDSFASEFALEFYGRLLSKDGVSDRGLDVVIGEALLETRLHFLRAHRNPLGLVYGLHGPVSQRLRIGRRDRSPQRAPQ